MIKRIAPFAGALALACAALIGCSDSSIAPDGTPARIDDPYVAYSFDNGTLNSFSEVPSSVDEIMNDPMFLAPPPPDSLRDRHGRDSLGHDDHGRGPDSLHHGGDGGRGPDTSRHGGGSGHGPGSGGDSLDHGGHGRGPDSLHQGGDRGRGPDTLHHGGDGGRGPDTSKLGGDRGRGPDTSRHGGKKGPDTLRRDGRDSVHRHALRDTSGRLKPINYGQLISQLGLSAEQDSLIRLCIAAQRECQKTAEAGYKLARRALFDSLQTTLRGIRAAVAAGSITRAEGNNQLKAANVAYRAAAEALAAGYRAEIAACEQDFDGCVRSHLTAEQIQKWEKRRR